MFTIGTDKQHLLVGPKSGPGFDPLPPSSAEVQRWVESWPSFEGTLHVNTMMSGLGVYPYMSPMPGVKRLRLCFTRSEQVSGGLTSGDLTSGDLTSGGLTSGDLTPFLERFPNLEQLDLYLTKVDATGWIMERYFEQPGLFRNPVKIGLSLYTAETDMCHTDFLEAVLSIPHLRKLSFIAHHGHDGRFPLACVKSLPKALEVTKVGFYGYIPEPTSTFHQTMKRLMEAMPHVTHFTWSEVGSSEILWNLAFLIGTKIETLRLEMNRDLFCPHLGSILRALPLKSLSLEESSLDHSTTRSLSLGLPRTLEEVSLKRTLGRLRHLFKGLRGCPLSSLDLSRTDLRPRDVRRLCGLVSPNLKRLKLKDCFTGNLSKSGYVLARMIPRLSGLEHLALTLEPVRHRRDISYPARFRTDLARAWDFPSLKTLRVGYVWPGIDRFYPNDAVPMHEEVEMDQQDFQDTVDMLHRMPALEDLRLTHCREILHKEALQRALETGKDGPLKNLKTLGFPTNAAAWLEWDLMTTLVLPDTIETLRVEMWAQSRSLPLVSLAQILDHAPGVKNLSVYLRVLSNEEPEGLDRLLRAMLRHPLERVSIESASVYDRSHVFGWKLLKEARRFQTLKAAYHLMSLLGEETMLPPELLVEMVEKMGVDWRWIRSLQ